MEQKQIFATVEAEPLDPAQELLNRQLPLETLELGEEKPVQVFPVSSLKRLGDLGASLILAGVMAYGAWTTWPEFGWIFVVLTAFVLHLAPRYICRMMTELQVYDDHFFVVRGRSRRRIDFEGLEVLPPLKGSLIPRDLVSLRMRQGGRSFRLMAPDFTDGRSLPRERFLELLLEKGVEVDYPGFRTERRRVQREEVWIRAKDPSPVTDGLLTIFLTLCVLVFGVASWAAPFGVAQALLGLSLAVSFAVIFARWRRRTTMSCLVYEEGGMWLFWKNQIQWEAPAGQIKGLVIETRARMMLTPEHRICVLTLYGRRYPITRWTWKHTVARRELLELARTVGLPVIYDEGSGDALLRKI